MEPKPKLEETDEKRKNARGPCGIMMESQSRRRFGRGARSIPGEIVAVDGGHIVRATGPKDRHSKVCTAKGTRDRRVRLSAHTAIQFYDLQDRLGYDRPSKAVDWLIKNAKSAIDQLQQLPPWHPSPPPFAVDEPIDYATDLLSFSTGHNQDLHLSLQSFQDPVYDNHHHNVSYAPVFNVPQPLQSVPGAGQFFAQGGPLQSSNPPCVRAWADPMALAAAEHPFHQSVQSAGFSGFCIPTRYQGEKPYSRR